MSSWVMGRATDDLKAMTAMFTVYSPSWVRMPARMAGMPHTVWSRPVASPAAIPASSAASMASHTLTPLANRTTNTAPPVQKEPSTVRSAMSSI